MRLIIQDALSVSLIMGYSMALTLMIAYLARTHSAIHVRLTSHFALSVNCITDWTVPECALHVCSSNATYVEALLTHVTLALILME